MRNILTYAAGLIAIAAPAFAASDGISPVGVAIRTLTYAGSGCPAGSAFANIAPDASALLLGFDNFLVNAAPGNSPAARRKICQISLDLAVPAGYSYAISGMSSLVYAEIAPDSRVDFRGSSYYSGNQVAVQLSASTAGPKAGDLRLTSQVATQNLLWSPCAVSRSLNLNLQQIATGRRVYLEGGEAGFRWEFQVKWRRCAH